ncbi:hypothetical protein DFJ74DRAFT_653707 [Hyaloraphidium curvatum]|nr:hypothetical protein DFJ74DRAFT_653707 [Hyaloraphidium curvatum]
MAEAVMASSTSARLEQYLLLIKSAKGAAAAQLIQDALGAPGVFVFAELLDHPNVKALENDPQHGAAVELLKLFAYGTYEDYKQNAASLPALTPAQEKKLKHLTLVTMSGEQRTLDYERLMRTLDIPTIRDLEDLIIDAIYQDILRAKLDQQRKQVDVEFAMGRDLQPGGSAQLLRVLGAWSTTSEKLLEALENAIQQVSQTTQEHKASKEAYEKDLEKAKASLKSGKGQQAMQPTSMDLLDMDDGASGDWEGVEPLSQGSNQRSRQSKRAPHKHRGAGRRG